MIIPKSLPWKVTVPLGLAAACTVLALAFQFLVVEKVGVGVSSDLY